MARVARVMGTFAQAATEVCRKEIGQSLALCYAWEQVRKPMVPVRESCEWDHVPELYRRMIAAAAGVQKGVIAKRHAQLTETEKIMLRSAITEMRVILGGLASL